MSNNGRLFKNGGYENKDFIKKIKVLLNPVLLPCPRQSYILPPIKKSPSAKHLEIFNAKNDP